jgi:hypothetical protein
VAPFSLLTYDDAAKRAQMIAEVAQSRVMPPWKLAANFGHFVGERRLDNREIATLVAWAADGAPLGNPADLPPQPEFAPGWQLGEPDLVLTMPEPYSVAADGPDVFRFFVVPIDIPEDKIVKGVEFRAGNSRVVHHSIMYLDTSGMALEKDLADPGPGYESFGSPGFQPAGLLGFWAPGYTPRFFPEGVGRKLPKGAVLAMQLHYHPTGKAETDQSAVGIYFADEDEPIERFAGEFAMISLKVDIPAGESQHRMQTAMTLPIDVELMAVTPHMHLIGKQMKVTAALPDGETVPIIWVDNWDFNWQDQYRLAEPLHLPAGTELHLEAEYDNSAANPYNPFSPPQRIPFGLGSNSEMCICAFHIIGDGSRAERRALQVASRTATLTELKPEDIARLIQSLGAEGLPLMKQMRAERDE